MFSEYRDLITRLNTEDAHFASLFTKHHELDDTIASMERGEVPATHEQIETLKKEKLYLKDQMYAILRKLDSEGQA